MFRRDVAGGLVLAGVAAVLISHGVAAQARGAVARPTLHQECMACHPRAHKDVLGRGAEASGKCGDCHATVHDAIQALYAGTAEGATLHPDPMYAAHVKCAECHTDSTFAYRAGLDRLEAIDRACVSCHGTRFKGMVLNWNAALMWRARVVSEYVGHANTDPKLRNSAPAQRRLQTARQALFEIAGAGGLHNIRGADALLRSARSYVAAAYAAAAVTGPPRPPLGPDPVRDDCVGCHYGIESVRDSVLGRPFDHGPHVMRAELACTDCHSGGAFFLKGKHEADPNHGKTTLGASSCAQCHHAPDQTVACAACHADDKRLTRRISITLPLALQPKTALKSRVVAFPHDKHAATACMSCHTSRADVRQVVACATCHKAHHANAVQCASCHGAELLAAHTADSHFACASCHARQTVALLTMDRTFCSSCHTGFEEHEAGRECSTCHMQSTPAEVKARILRNP